MDDLVGNIPDRWMRNEKLLVLKKQTHDWWWSHLDGLIPGCSNRGIKKKKKKVTTSWQQLDKFCKKISPALLWRTKNVRFIRVYLILWQASLAAITWVWHCQSAKESQRENHWERRSPHTPWCHRTHPSAEHVSGENNCRVCARAGPIKVFAWSQLCLQTVIRTVGIVTNHLNVKQLGGRQMSHFH